MIRHLRFIVLSILIASLFAGCASRRDQLHRVAKDWCETIRASQIIPVYPPTADLVPGDIFLVQETVASQHRAFEEDGFLPLPFEVARLDALGWYGHYDNVNSALTGPGMPGSIGANRNRTTHPTTLEPAPIAAFPTYSFSIRNGGSFDLAIPVSGVPIGISALGANSGAGSVSIKNVKTYGLDALSLSNDLYVWASDQDVKDFLAAVRNSASQSSERPVYIRVVSRVYTAREFDISITASASGGAGISAGASSPTALVTQSNADPQAATMADYQANLDALNSSIEDSITSLSGGSGIGGDARFVAASARSVSLKETFAEPLVVGYLGFDMAIRDGGELGPPIPTFVVLSDQIEPPDIEWKWAFTRCETRTILLRDEIDATALPADAYRIAATRLGPEALRAFEHKMANLAEGESVSEAWVEATRVFLPPGTTDVEEREAKWCAIADALAYGLRQRAEEQQEE